MLLKRFQLMISLITKHITSKFTYGPLKLIAIDLQL